MLRVFSGMRESGPDVRWMLMVRINFVKDVLSRDVQVSSIFMSYLQLRLLAFEFLRETHVSEKHLHLYGIIGPFAV